MDSGRADSNSSCERIRSVTLDDFWKKSPKLSQRRVDVMKIDVEGYEWNALQGASEMFRVAPPRELFLEFSKENLRMAGVEDAAVVLDWVLAHNYVLLDITTVKTGRNVVNDADRPTALHWLQTVVMTPGSYADLHFRHACVEPEDVSVEGVC